MTNGLLQNPLQLAQFFAQFKDTKLFFKGVQWNALLREVELGNFEMRVHRCFNKLMGIGNARRRGRAFPQPACDGGGGWTEILNGRVQDASTLHARALRTAYVYPLFCWTTMYVHINRFCRWRRFVCRDDAAGSSLCAHLINIIISQCGGDIIRLSVNSCCSVS